MSPKDRSSLAPILLGCVVAIAVLHAASLPVSTNDLHIFMAMGREMLQSGEILRTEGFTWTAQGQAFANPTWGFSLLSWGLHQAVGLEGLRLLNGLCIGWTLLWVALAARTLGADTKGCAVSALGAWLLLLQNLSVRGQTWVFWLLPALIVLAGRRRPLWQHLAGGVVLAALWSNLHASFPVALVWLGLWGIGAAWRGRAPSAGAPALWTALGVGVGCMVNPEVIGVWSFLVDNSSSPVGRGFIEWYPPELWSFAGLRLALACLLFIALALRQQLDWTQLVLVGVFALLAARGIRFIAWFGLAAAPLLGAGLRSPEGPGWPRRWVQVLGGALAALFAGLGLKMLPGEKGLKPQTPTHAVASLRAACGDCTDQRILNPPEYGGYLNVAVPGLQTSGDIRSWVFDDAAWSIYLDLSEAPADWSQRLAAEQVHWILVWRPSQGQTLLPAVQASSEWHVVSEDEMSLLARRIHRQ